MFEIPDDDLFSEENLKDLLTEADYNIGNQQKQSSTTNRDVDAHLASSADGNEGFQSPQNKKMRLRVLSDVNHPPRSTAGQKHFSDHQTTDLRVACISYNQADHSATTGPSKTVEPDVTVLSRKRSLRKFPGPAGILPPTKSSELASASRNLSGATPEILGTDDGNKQEDEVCSSQTGGDMFGGVAWQALVADLEPGADDVLKKFSVRAMLHKASRRLLPKGKVPLMLGILDSIDFQGIDASVILRDRTGQMQGTLHREVFKDFSTDLQAGAAVVLRQVSVISPSARTHYLNITAGNIVAIYPASGNTAQTVLPTSPEQCSVTQPSTEIIKKCVHAAEMEILEAANAAKETALSRLRRQGPSGQTSSTVSSSANRFNNSPGLFTNTRFQVPQSIHPGVSTPHRARQPSSPSLPAANRFSFKNTNSMSQMARPPLANRTPTPGVHSGMNSSAQSPHMQSSAVNSRFPQRHTVPGNPSQGIGPGNSVPSTGNGKSFNQGYNARLQHPPFSATTTTFPSNQTGVHSSNSCRQASMPLTSGNSMSNTVSHVTSHPRIQAIPQSATSPQPQPSSSLNQSSQQSRWSFRHKPSSLSTPVPVHSNPGSVTDSANRERNFVFKQNPSGQSTKQLDSATTGSSVRLGASTVSAGTNSGTAVNISNKMWDDELDDDILSQLSDDF